MKRAGSDRRKGFLLRKWERGASEGGSEEKGGILSWDRDLPRTKLVDQKGKARGEGSRIREN